ncbi:hypothetical protein K461DRAFT_325195 [Myriangium duriaei CBS 260.36]|uniref:Rhodopsin domain-containing protein n=1 Tax=Myriangium duriaei CBS 260.36 TaxID=1168546 RepID=A0A9P4IQD5_9PEZI|nr:hypothetical protein K461DRAFT_325195 [Myriangium duriaei CBS 260.36]
MSNTTSLRGQILGVAISLMVLPIPFVVLRFMARRLKRFGFGIDDSLLIVALLFNTASCITMIVGSTAGNLGSHDEFSPQGMPIVTHKHTVAFKCQYALQIMAYIGDGLTKLSILFLYRRLFPNPAYNIANTIWCIVIGAWAIAFIFGTVFQCTPINTVWLSPFAEATPGKCADTMPFYAAGAITDLITDVLVLALPIPMVWRLQLPTRKKIGVTCIFLLGAFVVAVGVVRVKTFYITIDELAKVPDIPYLGTKTFYWTTAETATGIICACLPTLPPLFDASLKGSFPKMFPKVFDSCKSLFSKHSGTDSSMHSRPSYKQSNDDMNSLISLPRQRADEPWEMSNTRSSHFQAQALPALPRLPDLNVAHGAIGVRQDLSVKTTYLHDNGKIEV